MVPEVLPEPEVAVAAVPTEQAEVEEEPPTTVEPTILALTSQKSILAVAVPTEPAVVLAEPEATTTPEKAEKPMETTAHQPVQEAIRESVVAAVATALTAVELSLFLPTIQSAPEPSPQTVVTVAQEAEVAVLVMTVVVVVPEPEDRVPPEAVSTSKLIHRALTLIISLPIQDLVAAEPEEEEAVPPVVVAVVVQDLMVEVEVQEEATQAALEAMPANLEVMEATTAQWEVNFQAVAADPAPPEHEVLQTPEVLDTHHLTVPIPMATMQTEETPGMAVVLTVARVPVVVVVLKPMMATPALY